MAAIMIILDGIQDTTYPELDGKTPYDHGKGEAFRQLEAGSATGYFKTTPPGFEPDTQTCVLTLLGASPEDIPTGRSYIEALAIGLPVGDDDIIMRCNFVQVDEQGNLAVPCCSAPEEMAKTLRSAVAAREGHSITPVGSYKSLQVVAGGRKYLETLVTSTPHQHGGEPFEQLLPRGNALAEELAAFSREQLRLHAPYTVLNWGPAVKSGLPAFASLHPGLRGGMVSKTDAPIGAAAAMGMDCPRLPTATGDTDTDLAAKVAATLELLEQDDFVMLHIGGPDEATHRQNPVEKAAFTTKLDQEMLAPLLDAVPDGTRIMVTCDHEALCTTAGHTDRPVKFWLYQKGAVLSGDMGVLEGVRSVDVLLGREG